MTGERLPNREIRENTTLKKTIQSFKDLLPQIQNNQNIKVDLETAIKLREEYIDEELLKKD
jgi:hypothetical protein